MIVLIILLSNLFSSLVTFITTREIYSVGHPLHGASVISLGELQNHESLQGLPHHHLGVGGQGERAGQGVTAGRVHGVNPRGDEYRDDMSGRTRARIDI